MSLTPVQVAILHHKADKGVRMGIPQAIEMSQLCDSHEALRQRAEEAEAKLASYQGAMKLLREYAAAERDEWDGRNADRYWQSNRFVSTTESIFGGLA